MKKRAIEIAAFVTVSALLIIICILSSGATKESEENIIKKSEEAVAKYNGLYIREDGTIISLYPYHGKDAFLKNMEKVNELGDDSPLPVYLAIPPRKMDVLEIPEDIDQAPSNALFELAKSECLQHNVVYIDVLSVMKGENLYFSTDHHWTSRGAYLAYCEIIRKMGEEPVTESEFTIEIASEKYRGSDYGKTDKSPEYTLFDTIELYYTDDYESYVTTIVEPPYDSEENNVILGGMYDLEAAKSWDPYRVYFRGNTPYITIRKAEERETLLVVRDSFASALAPFLALHFDIVMVDPRFCPERLSKIAEREKASAILVLENMGTFTENTIKFKY